MTRTIRSKAHLIALVLLIVGVTASPAFAGGSKLDGSWEVVAVPDGSGGLEIPFLATYEKDGTLITSGAGPTPVTSNGHGVWKKTGPRNYSTKSVILSFDSSGALVTKAVTMNEIEVDGNTYSGVFSIEIIDAGTGTVVATSSGTESGTRIELD